LKIVVILLSMLFVTGCVDLSGVKAYNNRVITDFYPKCMNLIGNQSECARKANALLITNEDVKQAVTRPSTCYNTVRRGSNGRYVSGTNCL
jgi:hypothetical protein